MEPSLKREVPAHNRPGTWRPGDSRTRLPGCYPLPPRPRSDATPGRCSRRTPCQGRSD